MVVVDRLESLVARDLNQAGRSLIPSATGRTVVRQEHVSDAAAPELLSLDFDVVAGVRKCNPHVGAAIHHR